MQNNNNDAKSQQIPMQKTLDSIINHGTLSSIIDTYFIIDHEYLSSQYTPDFCEKTHTTHQIPVQKIIRKTH